MTQPAHDPADGSDSESASGSEAKSTDGSDAESDGGDSKSESVIESSGASSSDAGDEDEGRGTGENMLGKRKDPEEGAASSSTVSLLPRVPAELQTTSSPVRTTFVSREDLMRTRHAFLPRRPFLPTTSSPVGTTVVSHQDLVRTRITSMLGPPYGFVRSYVLSRKRFIESALSQSTHVWSRPPL